MKDQIAAKDQDIKQMLERAKERVQEKQNDENKANQMETLMKSFYSLDRFDTNFTSDVAIYLKKASNDDSFVRSLN